MITEKDLENQDTFYKYGRDDKYEGEWYQGGFDCGVKVLDDGSIVFFLHEEVYGNKWFMREVVSLEDLKYLYEAIYPKEKFRMGKNKNFY